jgi:hypothetical protein
VITLYKSLGIPKENFNFNFKNPTIYFVNIPSIIIRHFNVNMLIKTFKLIILQNFMKKYYL